MQAGQLTARGQAARGRAIDAAERLFAERGLHGASVRDLAGALGVPPASLLHHFPRKEALYRAVLERIAGELGGVIGRAVSRPTDHLDRLRALVGRMAAWSHRHPRRSNLLLRELIDNPGRIATAPVLPLAPVVEQLAAFLRDGARAGAFRRVDPFLFLTHLAGSLAYFVAARPTFLRMARPPRTPESLYRAYRADLLSLTEASIARPPRSSRSPS